MKERRMLPEMILDTFGQSTSDFTQYSPLTLAYIGDAVFDLIIRTFLVGQANEPVKKLHKKACEVVKAKSQADLITLIQDALTEEEQSVFKRGRNAKSATTAKNATIPDYRNATGFEALIGYLYLSGHLHRALELVRLGMERAGMSF